MALSSNALCALTDLKNFIDIKTDTMDTELEGFIEAASDAVRSYLGYDPVETVYTDELIDGLGWDFIRVKHQPIKDISGIKVDDSAVDITDVRYKGRTIFLPGAFPSGFGNIKVSYTAGFSSSDMPALMKTTTLRLATLLYKERSGRIGTNSVSEDGGSRTYYEIQFTKYLEELFAYSQQGL